jgi:DNA (cytosine-5)-methyltransferase 1
MIKYYGTAVGQALDDPAHTLTQKARLGLVTVAGIDWQIIDIGMRMLIARELFRAQSFPDSYIIDPIYKGKPLTKTAQVSMCGNSVPPVMAKALCLVNLGAEMPIAGVAD